MCIIINVENVQCLGPPCNTKGEVKANEWGRYKERKREREAETETKIECKSNITSPEWHPELVMRCDLKVMNAFSNSWVFLLFYWKVDPAWPIFPHSITLKTSFFLHFFFYFFSVFFCSHQSRCSKLSCANLTQRRAVRTQASARTLLNVELNKKKNQFSLSVWNLSNHFYFTILKVRI